MADQREVFTIIEDNTTGAGIKLPGRQEGDTAAGNHAPVVTAKDTSGNYKLLELRNEGDSSAVDANPSLVAKDSSGNLAYLKLNADGELIISNDPTGTKKSAKGKVTPVSLGTAIDVCSITATAGKVYEEIEYRGSSSFQTVWELVSIDDVGVTDVETIIDEFQTGPGQFTFGFKMEKEQFTQGSTGTQSIVLRATQITGALSDVRGYFGVNEKL